MLVRIVRIAVHEMAPALRMSRLLSRDLKESQAFKLSQSSLSQQQASVAVGSGDGTREKLAKAAVKSSIVLEA